MENKKLSEYKWVFMGTPQISVDFLDYLKKEYDLSPNLIVTNPDQKVGRKQILTPSEVKEYAIKNSIDYIQASKLDDVQDELNGYDFFCVLAFGSLLKQHHLDLPKYGVVNIHPSLLPQYRGPSPITTAILNDTKNTGVTLMQLELGMDSGPIIAQSEVTIDKWDKWDVHEKQMAEIGATMFSEKMPGFLSKKIIPEEQNHEQATYCGKYTKSDMEINLTASQHLQYATYCAFEKPFFFNKKRYVVTSAHYDAKTDSFDILRVVPEGKQERDFQTSDIKD